MNRLILISVSALGVLLALGIDVTALIYSGVTLLLVAAGFSYMFLHRLPRNFWVMLTGWMIGPYIVAWLIKALVGENTSGAASPSFILGLVLLSLMVASFLYVRSRLNHHRNNLTKQLSTNERQPVFPQAIDDGIDRDQL